MAKKVKEVRVELDKRVFRMQEGADMGAIATLISRAKNLHIKLQLALVADAGPEGITGDKIQETVESKLMECGNSKYQDAWAKFPVTDHLDWLTKNPKYADLIEEQYDGEVQTIAPKTKTAAAAASPAEVIAGVLGNTTEELDEEDTEEAEAEEAEELEEMEVNAEDA